MSDFDEITIKLYREPAWRSEIWMDGHKVNNIHAVRVEQESPLNPVTIELSIYGDELAVSPQTINEVWTVSSCPRCKVTYACTPILPRPTP